MLRNKPGISPHIITFNVIPRDSLIFESVGRKELKGVQALFDPGAASARDVDPLGRLIFHVSITRE